jgi:hypothetical protein
LRHLANFFSNSHTPEQFSYAFVTLQRLSGPGDFHTHKEHRQSGQKGELEALYPH